MGKEGLYELINLNGNPYPDVFFIHFSYFDDPVVDNQAQDIRDVMKNVDASNKDCLDALQDLSIALSTGFNIFFILLHIP